MLGACSRRDASAAAQDLKRAYSLFPILHDREQQIVSTLSGGGRQPDVEVQP